MAANCGTPMQADEFNMRLAYPMILCGYAFARLGFNHREASFPFVARIRKSSSFVF
jgi:hypothetical protein